MDELIRQFGIDEKLLFAHAVNFFILLFLLKRFAYSPILNILAKRRKKIEEGLAMSEEAKHRLNTAEQECLKIIANSQKEALNIVTNAETAGKEKTKTILKNAAEKSEEIIADGKKRAEEERRLAAEEFSREAANLVRSAAAAAIASSPENIDDKLIDAALRELEPRG